MPFEKIATEGTCHSPCHHAPAFSAQSDPGRYRWRCPSCGKTEEILLVVAVPDDIEGRIKRAYTLGRNDALGEFAAELSQTNHQQSLESSGLVKITIP